jgi:hypothetical protein
VQTIIIRVCRDAAERAIRLSLGEGDRDH